MMKTLRPLTKLFFSCPFWNKTSSLQAWCQILFENRIWEAVMSSLLHTHRIGPFTAAYGFYLFILPDVLFTEPVNPLCSPIVSFKFSDERWWRVDWHTVCDVEQTITAWRGAAIFWLQATWSGGGRGGKKNTESALILSCTWSVCLKSRTLKG